MTRAPQLIAVLASIWLTPIMSSLAARADEPYPPGDPPDYARRWDELVTPSQQGIAAEVKQRNAEHQVDGDYMVFVDADGTIDHIEVVRSIPGCDDWLMSRFKGARLGGVHQRMRFVRRVTLTFSAPLEKTTGAPPKYRAVSPMVMEPQAMSTPMPKMPAAALKGGPKQGRYMLYVEPDGRVSRVDVIQSIAGGDQAVIDGVKAWKYKPQPERVRFVIDLAFR